MSSPFSNSVSLVLYRDNHHMIEILYKLNTDSYASDACIFECINLYTIFF